MKRFFLIITFAALSFNIFASNPGPIGIIGGLNSGNSYGESMFSSRIGFHLGGFFEIPITKGLSLCPTFQFLASRTERNGTNVNTNHIYIPLLLKYKWSIVDNFSFFVSAGPDLSAEITLSEIFSNEEYYTDQTDIGIGFNFGVEIFDKYQLSVGREYGLLYAGRELPWENLKNRFLKVSMAYLF